MSKVLKEYGMALSVAYPEDTYPQDLIDTFVMPALRRSFDRARREHLELAKNTTGRFDFKVGPVLDVWMHVDYEGGLHQCLSWSQDPCPFCETKLPLELAGYQHQFGWYVAVEVEEEEPADAVHN